MCGRSSGAIKRRVLIGLPFLPARQGRFSETYAKTCPESGFYGRASGPYRGKALFHENPLACIFRQYAPLKGPQ